MNASSRFLAAGALGLTLASTAILSHAQEWKKKIPVVGFSSVSAENQSATQARFKELADVFKQKVGVEMRIYTATDYSGTVQALTSGQIHMGQMGASAYSAAWIDSNGGVEPLVANKELDGALGYHSILIVKSDSPYKKLEDLKGKSMAWADPNSTSGYLIPLVSLRSSGIEPDKFFGKTLFSGGHEQSVLGVVGGQFDSGFTWSSKGHNAGQIRAMVDRGVLKMDQFRVIWESPLIPNPLVVVRKDKSLAFADPNSASGYLIPLVLLRAIGIDAEKFFGRTAYSGGHEQSALGVVSGQFDSAFVWGARDPLSRGVLKAMNDRGVLDPKRVRVIWRSPLIPGSPITVRKDLPLEMKRDIQKLFIDLQTIDPKMTEIVARGKTQGYVPVTHDMYQPILDATQEQRRNRRKN